MKYLLLVLLTISCSTHPVVKNSKPISALEVLTLETEEVLSGETYEQILNEKFPEEKLKEILLMIPILFYRFDVYGNLQFGTAIDTLYEYSTKNKLSKELAPILIESITRHLFMETTLENAMMLKQITNIDVGWDENYIKNFKGTKLDYKDRELKINQWRKWVEENKIRDLISMPLNPNPSTNIDNVMKVDLSKLEKLSDIAQYFTDLAYADDFENNICKVFDSLQNYGVFKRDIFQFYAIESLDRYSQTHSISPSLVPKLINCLKGTIIFKNSLKNANLLKKITSVDVGWEENYYKWTADSAGKEDPRDKMIKEWENWVIKNNIK